jgi:calcineurin-like phosphoesterase family protein
MSQVKFIGCLHLGHEGLIKNLRGFNSAEEHDDNLIKQWNKVVTKRDLVYILGDITMETSEHYYKLDLLNGRKKVILGNHDMGKDIPELLKYVETVEGMVYYKEYWITHCPIHPQELTFVKGNIHAHIHEMTIPEVEVSVDYWDKKATFKSSSNDKYYNVDAHLINYQPKTIEEIVNK